VFNLLVDEPLIAVTDAVPEVTTMREWLDEAVKIWTRLEAALIGVSKIPGIIDVSATIDQVHSRREAMIAWRQRMESEPESKPTIQ
jgi:hypothetical protein